MAESEQEKTCRPMGTGLFLFLPCLQSFFHLIKSLLVVEAPDAMDLDQEFGPELRQNEQHTSVSVAQSDRATAS